MKLRPLLAPRSRTARALSGLGQTSVLLMLGACTAPAAAPPSPVTSPREEMQRLIGSAACQRDDECRTLGVGALACGGPSGYVAWSARASDGTALQAAAALDSAERRQQLERSGMMSNCRVLPNPGARCERTGSAEVGRCVLNSSASTGLR
jgi:hypothetical protein